MCIDFMEVLYVFFFKASGALKCKALSPSSALTRGVCSKIQTYSDKVY